MALRNLFTARAPEGITETHMHVTPFAPPVHVRRASSSSSFDTAYGPDATSASDAECTPEVFEGKVLAALGLHAPREQETDAARVVLLARPNNATDEKLLFEKVMLRLRAAVHELEEDALIQNMAMALHSSQASVDTVAASGDVDGIMESMMGGKGGPQRVGGGGRRVYDVPPPHGASSRVGPLADEDVTVAPAENGA